MVYVGGGHCSSPVGQKVTSWSHIPFNTAPCWWKEEMTFQGDCGGGAVGASPHLLHPITNKLRNIFCAFTHHKERHSKAEHAAKFSHTCVRMMPVSDLIMRPLPSSPTVGRGRSLNGRQNGNGSIKVDKYRFSVLAPLQLYSR